MADTKETFKVFVTKYALTSGLVEIEATRYEEYACQEGQWGNKLYCLGVDAFESKTDAIANVKKRIANKRKSIEGQLKNLAKLEKSLEKL